MVTESLIGIRLPSVYCPSSHGFLDFVSVSSRWFVFRFRALVSWISLAVFRYFLVFFIANWRWVFFVICVVIFASYNLIRNRNGWNGSRVLENGIGLFCNNRLFDRGGLDEIG